MMIIIMMATMNHCEWSQVFVDQIFRIFDKDHNGSIDFRVRMMCVTLKLIETLNKKEQ